MVRKLTKHISREIQQYFFFYSAETLDLLDFSQQKSDCFNMERHKGDPSLPLFCKTMRVLNLSADDYVYPNRNNTTYKKLLRLLTCCNEHQLQVLLSTATALLEPVADTANNSNGED